MRLKQTTNIEINLLSGLCLCSLHQDALLDTLRRSRVHFVHCLLPKAEALSGELRVHGESCDTGLMQLDVVMLRAQLRGSKLLDALRIYRQGRTGECDPVQIHLHKSFLASRCIAGHI